MSANSNDEPIGLPASTISHSHCLLVEKLCGSNSFDKLDTSTAYILVYVFFLVGVVCDTLGIRQDSSQIDAGSYSLQTKGLPGSYIANQSCGSRESAYWRRAFIDIRPSNALALEQGHLGMQFACLQRRS